MVKVHCAGPMTRLFAGKRSRQLAARCGSVLEIWHGPTKRREESDDKIEQTTTRSQSKSTDRRRVEVNGRVERKLELVRQRGESVRQTEWEKQQLQRPEQRHRRHIRSIWTDFPVT